MCTRNQAITVLGEVYNSCREIFNNSLKDAYLYGSYARGDYNDESDIDILLTVDMDRVELSKYRNSIGSLTSELSLKYGVTVSVTAKPLDQFTQYVNILPFYKNVVNDGVRYVI